MSSRDQLVRVDDQIVTEANRNRLLIGKDVPGSAVALTVRKSSGEIKDVTITRMKSEQIADKRRIFELFTTILDVVAGFDERQATVVEECINLWTRMMLADAEHDQKIERNVQECIQRAEDKCNQLKENLVKRVESEHRHRSAGTPDDTKSMQNTLDMTLSNLAKKEQELASLVAERGSMVRPEQKTMMGTPRGQVQAVRDLSRLLSDPTRRGTADFERDLHDQMSAIMQLQNDLKGIHGEEQSFEEKLDTFEIQQSSQPLAHTRQALNLSRCQAELAEAQEELRLKNSELSRLRSLADTSPFKNAGNADMNSDSPRLLSKFGNLTKIFRDKEDSLAVLKDENQILYDQVQHLTESSDAMVRDINMKETEIARLHENRLEARRVASQSVRKNILQKSVGVFIRRWKFQDLAKAMELWIDEYREYKRIHVLELQVVGRWENSQIVGSYVLWKEHAVEFKRQRLVLIRVAKRWNKRVLAVGWEAFEAVSFDAMNARHSAVNDALEARDAQYEQAALDLITLKDDLIRMKEGVLSEVVKRRQWVRLASIYNTWRAHSLCKKRHWSVCNVPLLSVHDRVMYELVFERGSNQTLCLDEWKSALRNDISQALTKKCGTTDAALPQIAIGCVDAERGTALIEYISLKGGFDPLEMAAEVQVMMIFLLLLSEKQ